MNHTPPIETNRAARPRGGTIEVEAVLLLPGVLNNNAGRTLYLRQPIELSVRRWEGVPVTVDHPANELGMAASINDVDWPVVGEVARPRMEGNGLAATLRIDSNALKRANPDLLEDLLEGTAIEVSTGVFTADAKTTGNFGGRPYDRTVIEMTPDHLAILSRGTVGACSISDGCGTRGRRRPQMHAATKSLFAEQDRIRLSPEAREEMARLDRVSRQAAAPTVPVELADLRAAVRERTDIAAIDREAMLAALSGPRVAANCGGGCGCSICADDPWEGNATAATNAAPEMAW